jgi:ribosomal-protein-alanine N-acetyltransferase
MINILNENNIEMITNIVKNFPMVFSSKEQIENDFKNNVFTRYFIYLEKNNIIGFINYYDLYDRYEIANIYVKEENRNQKIGSKLLEKVIKLGEQQQIKNITLEVKKDNVYAIKLYEKNKFKKVAIRKAYYDGTDGILMERKMM